MKNLKVFLAALLILTLASCAHSPNVTVHVADSTHIYGFWGGVWHGMIMFFSFIGSLFDDSIKVYAVNNNGHWYDFGYVGGFGIIVRITSSLLKAVYNSVK